MSDEERTQMALAMLTSNGPDQVGDVDIHDLAHVLAQMREEDEEDDADYAMALAIAWRVTNPSTPKPKAEAAK